MAADDETVAVKVTGSPLLDGLELDVNVVVVLALFTVCASTEEVLPAWPASPLYCAVMECVPATRLEVEKVATPLPFSAELPRDVEPSMKVTLPVAPENGLTVAVNITCCPNADGLNDDVNAVVVVTGLADTVCVTEADVLPAKLASPV